MADMFGEENNQGDAGSQDNGRAKRAAKPVIIMKLMTVIEPPDKTAQNGDEKPVKKFSAWVDVKSCADTEEADQWLADRIDDGVKYRAVTLQRQVQIKTKTVTTLHSF